MAFEQNCKSCHGPDGHGITSVAPDLRRAGRRSLSEWVAYMKDPKGAHSSSKIPAMASLTEEDLEAIGGYLADLTQNNPPATKK
ncbi:MAG TPA: cytochrome c [Blastocatellia bacterium]|nr:cytochrome c [Blastocatellia bacterium]